MQLLHGQIDAQDQARQERRQEFSGQQALDDLALRSDPFGLP
jgi:hypothetical protein